MSDTWWIFNKYLFTIEWERKYNRWYSFAPLFSVYRFFPPQVNYCLNEFLQNPSLYHKCPLWETIKEAKRWPDLTGIHVSHTICLLRSGIWVCWPGPRSCRMHLEVGWKHGIIAPWTLLPTLPRKTDRLGWQVRTFQITEVVSAPRLSPGVLSRVWCEHIRSAYEDNDVYVSRRGLNLSSMAASLWEQLPWKEKKRWEC